MDSSDVGLGPAVGSFEHGNETLGSIKGVRFLDYLREYQQQQQITIIRPPVIDVILSKD
jgi:hypothetical protein